MSSPKAATSSPAKKQRSRSSLSLDALLDSSADDVDDDVMPLSDAVLSNVGTHEDSDEDDDDLSQMHAAVDDLDGISNDEEADSALRNQQTGHAQSADPAARAFRDDARIDRRIIEGMLRNRENFISEMEQEGFSQSAVLRRAAELGLSEALIRQVKGVAADLAGERPGRRPAPSSLGARTCLSCDRVFLSSGPGNRLCMRCRGGDAGLAQL